ncbi:GNAT family N-acetyltransferase [Kaistella palustris]|uniref:GNAT family N-acetyltransferase n=1 Tax=Kaistella palustris TaxID=493376 RepID=UPI000400B89B|nr:GNAT family N-acetyltransferase [Kaistella palustris]
MGNVIWNIKSFHGLSVAEIYAILKIRQEVFVVEQTCHYLDADGSDEKALHIWAEMEGDIVAYCRIFDGNIKYREPSIGRVLTKPSARKLGLGRELMRLALETIENRFGSSEVRISAQDYLQKFYSEFGFCNTGKSYLEDDIPHTEMLRS